MSLGTPRWAEGSSDLPGDSLEEPERTKKADMAVTSIWKKKEVARTQRLRSPNVRWKLEMSPAPSKKDRMAVSDFVQASDGVSTGRELTPRARNIVFPVCDRVRFLVC